METREVVRGGGAAEVEDKQMVEAESLLRTEKTHNRVV